MACTRPAVYLVVIAVLLVSAPGAWAHGMIGQRFLPATLAIDDPFVADELSLPTVSFMQFPGSGDAPALRQTNISGELSKRLSPNLGFTLAGDLTILDPDHGKKGTVAFMDDRDVLDFLTSRAKAAQYVTSVCTGGLLLGAAGLLRGYRATSHWYVRDLLPLMGAILATDRVVIDRNRVPGGGVTAGLDFGLALAAAVRGEDYARRIQLVIEYDPKPPYVSGSPETAEKAAAEEVLRRRAPLLAAANQAARRAKVRLGA